jgi:hypothetical protein
VVPLAPTGQAAALPSVVYEREPGAAARPLPAGYRRRESEKTVLYQVVREYLETFLDEARERTESRAGYPAFVERAFRRYLSCGLLSGGFARLRCPHCGLERLVAFSCKGRLCPSCWAPFGYSFAARRMADTAAHLVDRVLPAAPYRQWVLTFPWPLRLALATNRRFLGEMLRVYLRTLFAWHRRRGRTLAVRGGQPGAVTFLQRFGGALNTNPHLHSLLCDGLFVHPSGTASRPSAGATLTFVPLPPPSDDEIAALTHKLAARLGALARRRIDEAQDAALASDDEQALVQEALAEAQWVPRAGPPDPDPSAAETHARHGCAQVDGFTLHAARTVAQDDREALERLCRYGLRAPFSLDRFSWGPDGCVRYRLPKPWSSPKGHTELHLAPLSLLRRLAALLPAPYLNLIRYHGLFANRSRFRPRIPPPPPHLTLAPQEPRDPTSSPAPASPPAAFGALPAPTLRPRRLPSAKQPRSSPRERAPEGWGAAPSQGPRSSPRRGTPRRRPCRWPRQGLHSPSVAPAPRSEVGIKRHGGQGSTYVDEDAR